VIKVDGLCPSHTNHVISNEVRNLLSVNRENSKEAKAGKEKGKADSSAFASE
jgi:hypothetical protein